MGEAWYFKFDALIVTELKSTSACMIDCSRIRCVQGHVTSLNIEKSGNIARYRHSYNASPRSKNAPDRNFVKIEFVSALSGKKSAS